MLPEKTLPELDEALANKGNPGLILRYASGSILPQVKARYEKARDQLVQGKQPLCLSASIFYFLQHDPGYGEQELRRIFAQESAWPPICQDLSAGWGVPGRYAWSPALERLAIEYLNSPSVVIKKGVAAVLGKYGSAAAKKPLWDAMVVFFNWWKGREQELRESPNPMGSMLERELCGSLGQADGWVIGEKELKELLAVSTTQSCKEAVSRWVQEAKPPVVISVVSGPDGGASVAQYRLPPDENIRYKLSQFPPETAFRISVSGKDDTGVAQTRRRLEEDVRATGYAVAP